MGKALRRVLQYSSIAAIACVCAMPAAAAQPASVKDAWVRAPAPGQKVAGAYMEITGQATLWLIAVASPVAARTELHNTTLEDGVMKMRPIEKLELPGGRAVKLAPGGVHIMLIDLKQTLKPGDKVPITLTVLREDLSSRALFTVQAEVREAAAAKGHQHH
jgi:copper(I)-binding protein